MHAEIQPQLPQRRKAQLVRLGAVAFQIRRHHRVDDRMHQRHERGIVDQHLFSQFIERLAVLPFWGAVSLGDQIIIGLQMVVLTAAIGEDAEEVRRVEIVVS